MTCRAVRRAPVTVITGSSNLIIAMSGSFDVILDDGFERKQYHLNRSYYGLYVGPMMWREVENFSSASVCLVLASTLYEEADYMREYRTVRFRSERERIG
jgi:hypothetical protein